VLNFRVSAELHICALPRS